MQAAVDLRCLHCGEVTDFAAQMALVFGDVMSQLCDGAHAYCEACWDQAVTDHYNLSKCSSSCHYRYLSLNIIVPFE